MSHLLFSVSTLALLATFSFSGDLVRYSELANKGNCLCLVSPASSLPWPSPQLPTLATPNPPAVSYPTQSSS